MMHAESGSRVFEMDDHLSRLGGHVRYRLSQQATKAITRWSPDKVATLTSSEPTLSSGVHEACCLICISRKNFQKNR